MTLKTSFFSKAIYKSTLKRYMWGSVLYFILLFLSGGFSVLMNAPDESLYSYDFGFLTGAHMYVPLFMALVVPTITAMLVFRSFHSRSQAIFTFSLPSARSAVVISQFLGGLTLMIVPVVLNGIILLAISAIGYEWYITVQECFTWMGYNILGLFMMYSCAVLAASITGNAFSGVVINILLHCFLFITVSAFETMAEKFLYGFTHDNAIGGLIGENNFVVVLFGFGSEFFREGLTAFDLIMYFVESLVLCVLAYILFFRRKLQTASEVAGFRCLNAIFKYGLTLLTALSVFGIVSGQIGENIVGFTVILILTSLIVYSLSEMVIRKKLNVFYAWKGYACFGISFAMILGFFAFTSFFGYETKVPSADKVESVSVHGDYRIDEVCIADDNLIDSVIKLHSEIIGYIPVISDDEYTTFNDYIYITYNLKNGDRMSRRYTLSENEFMDVICNLYENEAYKKAHEPVFEERVKIVDATINELRYNGDIESLKEALKKDIMALDYKAVHSEYFAAHYDRSIGLILKFEEKNKSDKVEKAIYYDGYSSQYEMYITEDFVNTVALLKENGYIY